MFRKVYDFNLDISSWDVSNVVDMDGAFRETNAFNIDISQWDVSKGKYASKRYHRVLPSGSASLTLDACYSNFFRFSF